MNFSVTKKKMGPAAKAAEEYGIDLSLTEANLERTPTERLQVHQLALETVSELRRAWENAQHKHDSSKTPRTSG